MRLTFARVVRDSLDELRVQIPNLNPREEDWLEKEKTRLEKLPSTVETMQAQIDLSASREARIRDAHQSLGEVTRLLDQIIGRLPAKQNQSQRMTVQDEIKTWVELVNLLSEFRITDRLSILKRERIADVNYAIQAGGVLNIGVPEKVIIQAVNNWVILPFIAAEDRSIMRPPTR